MKIKKEFTVRDLYGEDVLVPVGETAKSFKGIIKMNNIGRFIWERTHKFCGALWLSGSLVFFPMFLFSNGYLLLTFAFIMIGVFTILPVIYTRYLHEKYLNGELKEKLHSKKVQHSH